MGWSAFIRHNSHHQATEDRKPILTNMTSLLPFSSKYGDCDRPLVYIFFYLLKSVTTYSPIYSKSCLSFLLDDPWVIWNFTAYVIWR